MSSFNILLGVWLATAALPLSSLRAQDFQVDWTVPTTNGWWFPMSAPDGTVIFLGPHSGDSTFVGGLSLPAPSPAGASSVCIAKLTAEGQPIWIRPMQASGLNGSIWASRSLIDRDGNVVFAGGLRGEVTLAGTTLRSGGANYVPLVVKMAQTGAVLWAKILATASDASAEQLAGDSAGNLYIAGRYSTVITFESLSATPTWSADKTGVFLAKLSPAGEATWIRSAGHPTLSTVPGRLATGPNGDVYLAGDGPDGMQFDALSLAARGGRDAYVVRYGSDGTPRWIFGCGSDVWDSPWGLAINRDGRCFTAVTAGLGGVAATSVTVGGQILAAGGTEFSFLVVLNSNGEPESVVPFTGASSYGVGGAGLVEDPAGHMTVFGGFRRYDTDGTVTLGVGGRSLTLSPPFRQQLFALNISAEGRCRWATALGTYSSEQGIGFMPGSPAAGLDSSFYMAGGRSPSPMSFGGQAVSSRFLARINLAPFAAVLSTSTDGRNVRLSWPTNTPGFLLQSATTLSQGGDWTNASLIPQVIDKRNVVTIAPTGPAAFFRLQRP